MNYPSAMCDFSAYSVPLYQKLGKALFGDSKTTESGSVNNSGDDYTEPLIPCQEKEAHAFQEEIFRRENRELKARCEKLAVQLRCSALQLNEKHERATREHISENTISVCGDLDTIRYHCDIDEFRTIVKRLQECSTDRTELQVARDKLVITVSELNSHRREQDERMAKLTRSNRLLVDTVMKYRSSVRECECKLQAMMAERQDLTTQISFLAEQVKQIKGQLTQEQEISNDLTALLCSAETTVADNASSLYSVSSNNISIANR